MRRIEIVLCGKDVVTSTAFSRYLEAQACTLCTELAFVHWCLVRAFGFRKRDVATGLFAASWEEEILAQYCPTDDKAVPSINSYVVVKCVDVPQWPEMFTEPDELAQETPSAPEAPHRMWACLWPSLW